jgi:hypothetical protein
MEDVWDKEENNSLQATSTVVAFESTMFMLLHIKMILKLQAFILILTRDSLTVSYCLFKL